MKRRRKGSWYKRRERERFSKVGTPGQMDHVFTRRTNDDPFLTFFVRCYKRPKQLARCLASMDALYDQDLEQIFAVDSIGRGLLWANHSPHCYRELVTGKYVYLMDDDFHIDDQDFIGFLKRVAQQHNPDIIVFRVYRVNRYLPMPVNWRSLLVGGMPARGKFSGDCFVVRREVWQNHIRAFGNLPAGNWHFATALWNNTPRSRIVFVNHTVARYKGRRGNGRPERRATTSQVLQTVQNRYRGQLVRITA